MESKGNQKHKIKVLRTVVKVRTSALENTRKLGVPSGYQALSQPAHGTTGTNQVLPGTLF